ncbi:MAG: AbrB/MazE/SpoVT family DNA-binding domain-containing protein [bacterium]|nr:AbrB/MazE/SpoVT family DNA-binding domain-containing protein [bacterium]
MSIVNVSPKGQVIIPVFLRRKFGISPKSKVDVTEINNEIVIIPLSRERIKRNARSQTLGEFLEMYNPWEDKRSAEEIVGEIYQARKSRQRDVSL